MHDNNPSSLVHVFDNFLHASDGGNGEKEVRVGHIVVNCSKADQIITLRSMSIMDLGGFIDFCQARIYCKSAIPTGILKLDKT